MPTPADDAPAVVAFRVGQLEKRFDDFDKKLDNLGGNYVTTDFIKGLKEEADVEHAMFLKRLGKLEEKTASYKWLETLVFGAVGIILVAILGAFISLVVIK